jgi:uncharacterized glyoxalase superfamily protein PhnB
MAQVHPIPKGMHTITPHLVCKDAAKAIDFYVNAFGAEELMRFPAPDGKGVWHAQLRIGDSVFLVSDDVSSGARHAASPDHPAATGIQLYVDDADALFWRATNEGAQSAMPVQEMFWGDRMGVVVDPFGHTWNISTRVRDLSVDEVRDRAVAEANRAAAQQQEQTQHA